MLTPLEITERIEEFVLRTEDNSPRTWLGASEIGEKCARKLWYSFRWCGQEKFDGRMLRLFRRGDREEPEFDRLLEGAGFIVRSPGYRMDRVEDFQFTDCEGHFRGTADGAIAEGDLQKWLSFDLDETSLDWCLLEKKAIKRAGSSGMDTLKRVGVKEFSPKFYSQMQTYMGEMGFERCLFCAVCKDDDELYFEWVEFDRVHFEVCLTKAEIVISSLNPPTKISNDPNTFSCRYCHFKSICHENLPMPQSSHHCRNCRHSSPAAGGTWECQKGQTFGTLCNHYTPVAGGPAAN